MMHQVLPVAPTLTQVPPPTCATNTGAITLVANAGSSYSFDNGLMVLILQAGYVGLLPGSTHTVSEQNAAGCNSVAASLTIDAVPGAPVAPTLNQVAPTCATNTGAITLVANAGSSYGFDNGPAYPYPAGGYVGLLPEVTTAYLNKMPLVVTLFLQA